MHPRQDLGEVAVALVGDDHRGAGLGDEEIGAGDADIGGEETLAQDAARLGEQRRRLGELAVGAQLGMHPAEVVLDLLLGQVHRRRDDVARRLVAKLDDVFAEVGLHRLDAVVLEMLVEGDLLGDHRLALGDRAGAGLAADVEHDVARLGRGLGVVHLAAGLDHLLLIGLEVEVEMGQRVVLDVARLVAQRLEFRQRVDRVLALVDEVAAHEPSVFCSWASSSARRAFP